MEARGSGEATCRRSPHPNDTKRSRMLPSARFRKESFDTHRDEIMLAPTEKRQRTPRACDECKKKKKQCSGSQPCSLCSARSRPCVFSNTPASVFLSKKNDPSSQGSPNSTPPSDRTPKRRKHTQNPPRNDVVDANDPLVVVVDEGSKNSVDEDETPVRNEGRMLQDGEGRLLYVGDSASLSFLQTIRRLVEGILGASPFTLDVNRHKILEASVSTPPRYQHTFGLPDIEAALHLTESFFTNTTGLFEVFDKESFASKVKETYSNPLAAEPQWLCQLNLVFAVGMQFRKDYPPRSAEAGIFDRLEARGVNRSELFFLASKHLSDPVSGFEDGGFASVQSLLLMTIYMLTASKRNTAWAYLGMATRLGYALGLHKEETLSVFSRSEQDLRRKLWQSLYVMDCFLSASLGRPNAISLSELLPLQGGSQASCERDKSQYLSAFLASYTASKITGEVLSRVYQNRKASRSVALEISMHFNDWMKELPPTLHWQQVQQAQPEGEMSLARLHLNLIYFHGIVLLTRPFLLYQINLSLKRSVDLPYDVRLRSNQNKDFTHFTQANCFHGACVRSAVHSITLIHVAFSAHVLPRRDPFVIYWLFSAALVVLANAFCPVHHQPNESTNIQTILQIMRYMGEEDPQGRRYLNIVESFNDAIQNAKNSKEPNTGEQEGQNIFNVLFGSDIQDSSVPWTGGLLPQPSNEQGNQPWPNLAMSDGNLQISQPPQQVPISNDSSENPPFNQAAWPTNSLGAQTIDDSIDFDSFWWPGQGTDALNGDSHVPLYMMKPM